ncbi:MAG: signal recognition particle-docking protein FtsY [Pseudomonadota bacterium]
MTQEPKQGWFSKLKLGLQRSSNKLTEGISAIVTKRKLDDAALEALEELLISADLGVETALKVTQALAKTRFDQEVSQDEIRSVLAAEIEKVLTAVAKPLVLDAALKPYVILLVGVNGSGKTTTMGKLGKLWQGQGHQVRFVAGDTFRAAAVEQLQKWGERTQIPVVTGKPNCDAAGLIYQALEQSKQAGDDILLIDTAGRLQNKVDLMAELGKIARVIKKVDASAPHSCLLVLDATVGQNAHSQVETFAKTVDLTGLVMTKLDGTARGGVLVSLAQKFPYPIHAIGVGEGADDLRPFSASDFAKAVVRGQRSEIRVQKSEISKAAPH